VGSSTVLTPDQARRAALQDLLAEAAAGRPGP